MPSYDETVPGGLPKPRSSMDTLVEYDPLMDVAAHWHHWVERNYPDAKDQTETSIPSRKPTQRSEVDFSADITSMIGQPAKPQPEDALMPTRKPTRSDLTPAATSRRPDHRASQPGPVEPGLMKALVVGSVVYLGKKLRKRARRHTNAT